MHYVLHKEFVHSSRYKGLDWGAVILYTLFYDRSLLPGSDVDELVEPDKFVGPDGRRLFIVFSFDEMMTSMDCGKADLDLFLRQLSDANLINVIEQPGGRPPVIFVNSIDSAASPLSNSSSKPALKRSANDISPGSSPVTNPIIDPTPPNMPNKNVNNVVAPSTKTEATKATVDTSDDVVVVEPRAEYVSLIESFASGSPHGEDNQGSKPSAPEASAEPIKQLLVDSGDDKKLNPEAIKAGFSNSDVSDLVSAAIDGTGKVETETQTAPYPHFEGRNLALHAACNEDFSMHDIHTIWTFMNEQIDEKYWDNYGYLFNWLSEKYKEMYSRFGGGDSDTRLDGLIQIINKSK